MDYSVKNVRTFMGREGYGYSCSVYKGTKKIGEAVDSADGAPIRCYWSGKDIKAEIEAYIDSLPEITYEEMTFFPTLDIFIGGLVDVYERNRELLRLCNKNWVFKVKDSEEGVYIPKNQSRKEFEAKFPNWIIECLNDKIGG